MWLSALATGFFFIIDVTFFASNMLKLVAGGWFPIVIGIGMFTLMLTWMQGRKLMADRLRDDAIDLTGFLEAIFISPPTRVPGTAVFLSADIGLTPNALLHNLKHNKVLHEYNLFVTVRHHEVPWIGLNKRIEMDSLGHDCWQVVLHFGFKNDPDVPEALQLLEGRGIPLPDMDTSYFLSRDIVIPTFGDGMAMWREKLFAGMHHNAAGAADFLRLPSNRIVELGRRSRSELRLGARCCLAFLRMLRLCGAPRRVSPRRASNFLVATRKSPKNRRIKLGAPDLHARPGRGAAPRLSGSNSGAPHVRA